MPDPRSLPRGNRTLKANMLAVRKRVAVEVREQSRNKTPMFIIGDVDQYRTDNISKADKVNSFRAGHGFPCFSQFVQVRLLGRNL